MSSLLGQIKEALVSFAGLKTPPALIGGLALASHGVVRATRDVDFLVDADDADRLHDILLGLGYRCIHRSEDAANYLRGEDRLRCAVCPPSHGPEAVERSGRAPDGLRSPACHRCGRAHRLQTAGLCQRPDTGPISDSAPCSRPMPASSTWTKWSATLHSSIGKICWRR